MQLKVAEAILSGCRAEARRRSLKPLAIVILDARGAVKAAMAEDGTSLKRFEVAHAKAYGALAMGVGSRALYERVQQQPYFIAAVSHVVGGALVPVPGGVLIRDEAGVLLGAIGISGDTSDNDEAAGLAGIGAAGLAGDKGA